MMLLILIVYSLRLRIFCTCRFYFFVICVWHPRFPSKWMKKYLTSTGGSYPSCCARFDTAWISLRNRYWLCYVWNCGLEHGAIAGACGRNRYWLCYVWNCGRNRYWLCYVWNCGRNRYWLCYVWNCGRNRYWLCYVWNCGLEHGAIAGDKRLGWMGGGAGGGANGGKRSCGRRVGGRRSLRRTVLAPNDRGAKGHEANSWGE